MTASDVFLVVAACLLVFGNIWMIINGFRVGIVWGLLLLFIPLMPLVFLFAHWPAARRPFLCQFFGVLALIPLAILNWDSISEKKDEMSRVILEMESSKPQVEANKETPAAILAKKQATLLAHANEMNVKYLDLINRQKTLASGDTEGQAAFAADSAAYAELRKQVAAEKAEVEALQAKAGK